MTHISQFAVKDFYAYENSNELKEYQVEVITFDGESETVYVWKNRSRLGQCAGADWDTFDAAKLMIFSETVAF